jgi:hypothetical protein
MGGVLLLCSMGGTSFPPHYGHSERNLIEGRMGTPHEFYIISREGTQVFINASHYSRASTDSSSSNQLHPFIIHLIALISAPYPLPSFSQELK